MLDVLCIRPYYNSGSPLHSSKSYRCNFLNSQYIYPLENIILPHYFKVFLISFELIKRGGRCILVIHHVLNFRYVRSLFWKIIPLLKIALFFVTKVLLRCWHTLSIHCWLIYDTRRIHLSHNCFFLLYLNEPALSFW